MGEFMLLIKNVRVIDPKNKMDRVTDIYCRDGKVCYDANESDADCVVDCTGLIAAPGLIDMHVHFRDPGFTYKEDIITGANAAAAGGITTVACMPNTKPVVDSVETVEYILKKAKDAPINVLPFGAVTVGQEGDVLTDFAALKTAGVCAFSDDGVPVQSADIMRHALIKAGELGMVVCSHCEDKDMVGNLAVNEGAVSKRLGLKGRPAIAEEIMVARDAMLAAETGCPVHICHVSTKNSVGIIREAKRRGVPITAETCPQYFTLTEDVVLEKGALARVNPPLRTEADRVAVLDGIYDGTLDIIVTDHAPHSEEEKGRGLVDAPSGMVGLETSLAVVLTELYHKGVLSLEEIIAKMSMRPAEIFRLEYDGLAPGANADIIIFDTDEEWNVDAKQFKSKGCNTPFNGARLKGRVKYTIVNGEIKYKGV